ncbi:MAG: dihydroxy-acid dehydratase [Candidatus Hydrothermarchaeales archaeon]
MEPKDVKGLPAVRALLHALGLGEGEIEKPIVAVVNSFNEIVPGHVHLNEIVKCVKNGVIKAGGTPIEFPTIGVCDGIAMGHDGMKYSLPSREMIADTIEDMVRAHGIYDGIVLVAACDKNVPGILMAAARLDMPSIVVTGGPMLPGRFKGKRIDVKDAFAADGQYAKGVLSREEYEGIIRNCCPGPGSCAGLFTANSMACVTEALGMSLPGCATAHAVDDKKKSLATSSGRQVMKLIKEGITAKQIMNETAFENAFAVDMAIGGSTNTVLHIPTIAKEAGYDFDLDRINEISKKTPNIVKISPSSEYRMIDFDRAGGVPAVISQLRKRGIVKDTLTVHGGSWLEAEILDISVIRPIEDPYSETGGIAILKGSLAPNGSVIKESGVASDVPDPFEGFAKVFNSEEDATDFIKNERLEKGMVIVIRYEGPAGGPGMREMLYPTSAISGLDKDKEVALITDGRFSGATKGICIGHVEPEAYFGGPIALLRDGDKIRIDLKNRKLDLLVDGEELEKRREGWEPIEKEIPERGVLANYRARFK